MEKYPLTTQEARKILKDQEAEALIAEHKIQLGFDDDRHPTVFMVELLEIIEAQNEKALQHELARSNPDRAEDAAVRISNSPYFAL